MATIKLTNVIRESDASPLIAAIDKQTSYMQFRVLVCPVGGSFDVVAETDYTDSEAEASSMLLYLLADLVRKGAGRERTTAPTAAEPVAINRRKARCPRCGLGRNLFVTASIDCQVGRRDEHEPIYSETDMEWTADSPTYCDKCEWTGTYGETQTREVRGK